MCYSLLKTYIKRTVNLFRCILLHKFLSIPKGFEGRSGATLRFCIREGPGSNLDLETDYFVHILMRFVSRFWIVSQIMESTLPPTLFSFRYSLILSFAAKGVKRVPASYKVYLWTVRESTDMFKLENTLNKCPELSPDWSGSRTQGHRPGRKPICLCVP
jgi:hypothetical protein